MDIKVGQTVQYFGTKGTPQAALVLMTGAEFDSEKAGYGMEAPAEGAVSVLVFGVSGRSYVRHNVPMEGSEAHAALVEKATDQAQADAEGIPADADDADEIGYTAPAKPVTVRFWKPIA